MTTSFKKDTAPKKRSDGKSYTCDSCGLLKNCQSPRMRPHGNFNKGIMVIGEAPGEVEDEKGRPWQGPTGRLLSRFYRRLGIDLFEDCISLNAVNCRPRDNRAPTNFEIECCRIQIVNNAIKRYNPKVIVLLGGVALQSVVGARWKRDLGGISKWRGFAIPDQDLKCWVCPTFHPSYISRMDDGRADTIWIDDLTQTIELTDKDIPRFKEPEIILSDEVPRFDQMKLPDLTATDIETTGLKPHGPGHRIVCASVAVSENKAYSFMMPQTPRGRKPYLWYLANNALGKMAHNMKFEDTWFRERLNAEINNWEWDSMLAAHTLDNRSGITSLKFQTYVNFGIADYDSEVYPFLRGTEWNNTNSHNTIMELVSTDEGKDKLLTYCGWDSVLEYRLAMQQIKQMNYSFLPF